MAEFAILMPLFALLLVAGVDVARVFYHQQTITNCARNGALYLSDPASPLRSTYPDYQTAALADASGLNPALTASNISSTSGADASGPNVSVTVTYKFATISNYLGFSTVNLSRTVTMRVVPLVPTF
jgi:Flp pilus assembly protein TadG